MHYICGSDERTFMFFRLQTRWSFNYSRLLRVDSRIKYGVVLTDVENWLLHVNI